MPLAVGRNQPGAGRGIPCLARVDFNRHMEFPVSPIWLYSTFHRYVCTGIYPTDWGDNVTFENDGAFGE
jgi:hypothetical protein